MVRKNKWGQVLFFALKGKMQDLTLSYPVSFLGNA